MIEPFVELYWGSSQGLVWHIYRRSCWWKFDSGWKWAISLTRLLTGATRRVCRRHSFPTLSRSWGIWPNADGWGLDEREDVISISRIVDEAAVDARGKARRACIYGRCQIIAGSADRVETRNGRVDWHNIWRFRARSRL